MTGPRSPTHTDDGARIIIRYVNRRLYDVSESRYITFAQIVTLIRGQERVAIFCKETGRDITRDTLLQVLREVEASREQPALAVDKLHEMLI